MVVLCNLDEAYLSGLPLWYGDLFILLPLNHNTYHDPLNFQTICIFSCSVYPGLTKVHCETVSFINKCISLSRDMIAFCVIFMFTAYGYIVLCIIVTVYNYHAL